MHPLNVPCRSYKHIYITEREVAYNLMQAIKSGGRKRSAYKATDTRHVRHPTAGVKTSYSVWDQYKNPYWDDKEMVIAGRSIG